MAEAWTLSAAGEIAERWDFLTDVLPPPTGEEQRRRLRPVPRIFQQFDGLESAARRRRMEHLLHANGAGDWDVPLPQDLSLLTAAADDGDTTVMLDTTTRRFVEGGRALVMLDDPLVFEVRTIASVAGDSLVFTVALARDWPIGTKVVPVFEGKLATMPALERFTSEDVPVRMEFQLTEAIDWTEDAGAAVYRDLPVLEIRPDWSTAPQVTPERRLAIVDNDTSIPTWYDQPGIPFTQFRLGFTLQGRAAIADFWSLLYALSGRWSPIWVPSFAVDMLVTADLTSAATTLDIEAIGLADWPLQVNRRDIRILLADGTVLYRRITDADAVDADTERLTLDSALGVNADTADVVMVSFLSLCRQDTDTNLLRYWSHDVVLSELTFRGYLHAI
jgi:hypothetical protein